MSHKILFVGAGAVGSYLASFFARAGHDVTAIDSWPEQVEAIRQRGVAVTGPHEPFNARFTALHMHEAQQLGADFDIGIVAMKSYDTAWAAHLLAPHVKPSGIVICAQNCWNDPLVASIAGGERTVGLIMSGISVAMWKPGKSSAARSAARATWCSGRAHPTASRPPISRRWPISCRSSMPRRPPTTCGASAGASCASMPWATPSRP